MMQSRESARQSDLCMQALGMAPGSTEAAVPRVVRLPELTPNGVVQPWRALALIG